MVVITFIKHTMTPVEATKHLSRRRGFRCMMLGVTAGAEGMLMVWLLAACGMRRNFRCSFIGGEWYYNFHDDTEFRSIDCKKEL